MAATEDTALRLLVTNLPARCSEDTITLYFESRRRFGRTLTVNHVERDQDSDRAIVSFESNQDLQTVLDYHQANGCSLQGRELCMNLYRQDKESAVLTTKTIEVRGYPKSSHLDSLRYYFENTGRSGGGEINEITMETGDDETIHVTFCDANAVESVTKKTHTLSTYELRVRPIHMSKTEVFLTNLPDHLPEETLTDFLTAKLNNTAVSVTYNGTKDAAVVTFETPIDFSKAQVKLSKSKFGGRIIGANRVPVTNCLYVSHLPDTTTEEAIRLYFENKRRSGGGDVDKITYRQGDDRCFIYFSKEQDVLSACSLSTHALHDTILKVAPHHTCLGLPAPTENNPIFLIPEPITIEKEEKRKMKLLTSSVNRGKAFYAALKENHGKISEENKRMIVECTLTPDTQKYRTLVKCWRTRIQEIVHDAVQDLVTKPFQLDESTFLTVRQRLKTIVLQHPTESAVFPVTKDSVILLVSYNSFFRESCQQIQSVIDTVKREIYINSHQRTKSCEFKRWQINYLLFIKYGEKKGKEKEQLSVTIDIENNAVEFQGLDTEVSEAVLDLYGVLQLVKEHKIRLEPEVIALLENKDIKGNISKAMKRHNMMDIWEVCNDSIKAVVTDDTDIEELEDIFHQFYTNLTVPIGHDSVLKDPRKLDRLLEILDDEFGATGLSTRQSANKLILYILPGNANAVEDRMDRFLEENSTYEEVYRLDEHILTYLQKCLRSKLLLDVADIRREHRVEVDYGQHGNINIKGTKNGIKAIRNLFGGLSRRVESKIRKMKQPGIIRFLESSTGKEALANLEDSTPCFIHVKTTKVITSVQSLTGGMRLSEAVLPAGQTIVVYGGNMALLSVDVLVNASNIEMKHAGGLAATIVKAGGQSIQDECNQYVADHGSLDVGGVFMGTPGGLPCKAVAHAVGPQWRGGNKREQQCLQNLVKQCLKEADQRGFKSIAFPALCTGQFRYPVDKSCADIVTSVLKYFKGPDSGIKEVFLCDINVKTVHNFIKATKQAVNNVTDLVKLDHAILQQPRQTFERTEQPKPKKPALLVGKTTVELVNGNMSFEKVDIIVNSTTPNLKLDKGQASKALLKAGGDELQADCTTRYPNGVAHGDVAVTSAGKLKCKEVFHVAVKPHKETDSLQIFQTTIANCLLEADKLARTSIAFPAIGTGAQGFPKDVAAGAILTGVIQHCTNNPNTTLTCVRLVLYKNDSDKTTYDVFNTEFKKYAAQYPPTPPPQPDAQSARAARSLHDSPTKHLGSVRHKQHGTESCVMTVYADSVQKTEKVFTVIKRMVAEEWFTEKIEDDSVWKLDQAQVQKIDTSAKLHDVYVCVDQDIGAITIEGLLKDATSVMDVVCEELRAIDKQQHEQQHAQLKHKLVKWTYDDGTTTVEFPEIESYRIEIAHESKSKTVKQKNSNGEEYTVDFQTMKMTMTKKPGTDHCVHRNDLVKGSLASFKLPTHWDPMKAGEKVKNITLAASSAEYQNAVKEFTSTLGRTPNILKVERVQNPYLFAQYFFKREEMNKNYPSQQNERVLWHGTDAVVIQSIITNGFNRSYLTNGAYGAGVYFAVNSQYSDGGYARPDANGHKRMLRSLVLVGHSIQGSRSMRYLPDRQPGVPYDTSTNSTANPGMFVIYNDTQAYAEHIITYT